MLFRAPAPRPGFRVLTFELPADHPAGRISVVGTFNGWTPGVDPFVADGPVQRVAVTVPDDVETSFRYLGEHGWWFDDRSADWIDDRGSHVAPAPAAEVADGPAASSEPDEAQDEEAQGDEAVDAEAGADEAVDAAADSAEGADAAPEPGEVDAEAVAPSLDAGPRRAEGHATLSAAEYAVEVADKRRRKAEKAARKAADKARKKSAKAAEKLRKHAEKAEKVARRAIEDVHGDGSERA